MTLKKNKNIEKIITGPLVPGSSGSRNTPRVFEKSNHLYEKEALENEALKKEGLKEVSNYYGFIN